MTEFATRTLTANGIQQHVATAGTGGPVLVLLHGWPHTWFLWRNVMRALAADHRLVAPDLRGLGSTGTPGTGYDLHTLADDGAGLRDGLDIPSATVVGIDLGAPVAFMTAHRHPQRVERLALIESVLGTLPGAEPFLAAGPPWWFGFHAVPGLAERVLHAHVADYIDWFLQNGTHREVAPEARDAFVLAYEDPDVLRAGFEHYRALAANSLLLQDAAQTHLHLPVLAVGGSVVGEALHRQLAPLATDLQGTVLPDCGHIVPEDAPAALVDALRTLLARPRREARR